MRLKNREIQKREDIIEVIQQCEVCRVAMFDEVYPYIVPMNFGLELKEEGMNLYFHTALMGKKIDLLRKNPHVAFEMDCSHEVYVNETNTMCSMAYASVMGEGIIEEVKSEDMKQAIDFILSQYPKHKDVKYNDEAIQNVIVWRLKISKVSGKCNRKRKSYEH